MCSYLLSRCAAAHSFSPRTTAQLYCSNGISPMENSGCFPRGKPAETESRNPTYGAWWVFYCFYNPPNSDMDYRIFNVRTNVNACDCAWGCANTERESALKVDSGRKILCRTGESNLFQRRAGPTLYQLSYIPTPFDSLHSCALLSSLTFSFASPYLSSCSVALDTARK